MLVLICDNCLNRLGAADGMVSTRRLLCGHCGAEILLINTHVAEGGVVQRSWLAMWSQLLDQQAPGSRAWRTPTGKLVAALPADVERIADALRPARGDRCPPQD